MAYLSQWMHLPNLDLVGEVHAQLMHEDLKDDLVDTVYKINAINEPYLVDQIKQLEHKIQVYYMANDPAIAAKLNENIEQQFLVQ